MWRVESDTVGHCAVELWTAAYRAASDSVGQLLVVEHVQAKGDHREQNEQEERETQGQTRRALGLPSTDRGRRCARSRRVSAFIGPEVEVTRDREWLVRWSQNATEREQGHAEDRCELIAGSYFDPPGSRVGAGAPGRCRCGGETGALGRRRAEKPGCGERSAAGDRGVMDADHNQGMSGMLYFRRRSSYSVAPHVVADDLAAMAWIAL